MSADVSISIIEVTYCYRIEGGEPPDYTDIINRLTEIDIVFTGKEQKKELEKIDKEIKALLDSDPKNPKILFLRGACHCIWARRIFSGARALHRAGRAREYLEEALQLEPKVFNGKCSLLLGALYYFVPTISFGDPVRALELLKQGYDQDPDSYDANLAFADYYFTINEDYAQARTYYENALRALPAHDQVSDIVKVKRETAEEGIKLCNEKLG